MTTEIETLTEKLRVATEEIESILGPEPREKPLSDEEQQRLNALDEQCTEVTAELKDAKEKRKAEAEFRKKKAERERMLEEEGPGPITTPETPEPAEPNTSRKQRIAPLRFARGRLKAFPNNEEGRYNAFASGQWFLAVLGDPQRDATQRAKRWCREHLAMSATAITKGSALVPDVFERTVIDLREEYGVFRQEARLWTMDSDSTVIPRRTGGVTAYFVGENEAITASDKTWDQVELIARKLGFLGRYSSELSEDSVIAMADDLADEAAWAFAKKEDECGFLGDGTSTYGGVRGLITKVFQSSFAGIVEAAAANTSFGTLDLDDFEAMVGKLPQYAESGAKWYISKVGWAHSMLRLIEAAGGQTGAMIAGQVQKMFLGYPVVISQVMNSTTTAQTSTNGLAYLGNLRLAASLGDRRGITVKTSEDRYLEYDQIGIQATERFAINVHDVGDTTNAGPVVGLATPSS